jgi:hypothetical protein
MYRKILGIRISFMDQIQRIKLVNVKTTRDKGLIQTRGRRTIRNPKMTISVIDVEIFLCFAKNYRAPKHLVALY